MSDCEIPEFYSEVKRKARKRQQCCECLRAIEIGELYVVCSGKWDGEFQSYKQHLSCYEFARKINGVNDPDFHGECEVPFGGVADWLENDLFSDAPKAHEWKQEWAAIVGSHNPLTEVGA